MNRIAEPAAIKDIRGNHLTRVRSLKSYSWVRRERGGGLRNGSEGLGADCQEEKESRKKFAGSWVPSGSGEKEAHRFHKRGGFEERKTILIDKCLITKAKDAKKAK